jgi:dihydrofolate reductase
MSAPAKPALVIVAAIARNNVIGRDNRLLWRLSSDLQRFKALTMGKPLLMGRKTFESIGRPLPGRTSIVMTRDPAWTFPGVIVAHDLQKALRQAAEIAADLQSRDVMVVGGADLYAQTIGMADRMHITHVELEPAGDSFFPAIDSARWKAVRREDHPSGPKDEAAFSFVDYEPN